MGNLLRHGVDMYKKTISLKDTPKQGLTEPSPENKPLTTGLIKTSKTPVVQPDFLKKTVKPDETPKEPVGIEAARRILYAAKGPEKGEELLNRAVPASRTNLFTFLEDFSPEQLSVLLKDETDQTAALILARLPSKLTAGILGKLPKNRKPEILRRIAHQGEILPEILEQVSLAFKEKVRHISGGAKDIQIDGMQTLAAILKQGDYSFGDRLINELEAEDPNIGQSLKDKIYTIDDIVNTIDRPIQDKLKMMTEREIAILLKGRNNEFNEKILSNVSAGRRQIIREEFAVLGAVPKRDCDDAARDFLTWFKLAREKGEIILFSDEDVFI